ncbi:ABC transporter ATP-binding protein [Polycladidibacter hongkongensis]|uniref:ABC transporter ATP-binding protein n=1 Tax=Polycladidibacter hongkongensis TaxID=1647556 RepID=UPI000836B4CD|nr:sn-glycerol-3-phosphate ABC transporter ATP-binding protein UgpC [Pseudovibrio hongkongensis]
MSSLDLLGISKSFGATEVLKNIDIHVSEGEFIALVGPSGCGKSTLLRLISGLDEPTSGDVVLGQHVVNDLTPRERNVAMVFQSYALYPHMNVAENIGFNLRISGVPKAEINQRVADTAAILDLTELLTRKPSQLSGGQRQRVAMGRALVRNPSLFLFDEPLSNLDAKLRVQMREEIKRLHAKVRTTSIYVTHDQIEAMTLADRIVILNEGIIQQVGTPKELYTKPANPFVAGFIGSPSMNLLEGKLTQSGDTIQIELDGGVTLPCPQTAPQSASGRVIIGMRPEHLHLGEAAAGAINITGRLDHVEPTGAQNHLKVKFGKNTITATDNTLQDLASNAEVTLSLPTDKLHIFAN